MIILSIPFATTPDAASLLTDVPADVVVIDTSTITLSAGQIPEVDDGEPESV